jgi:hypothetical protein
VRAVTGWRPYYVEVRGGGFQAGAKRPGTRRTRWCPHMAHGTAALALACAERLASDLNGPMGAVRHRAKARGGRAVGALCGAIVPLDRLGGVITCAACLARPWPNAKP